VIVGALTAAVEGHAQSAGFDSQSGAKSLLGSTELKHSASQTGLSISTNFKFTVGVQANSAPSFVPPQQFWMTQSGEQIRGKALEELNPAPRTPNGIRNSLDIPVTGFGQSPPPKSRPTLAPSCKGTCPTARLREIFPPKPGTDPLDSHVPCECTVITITELERRRAWEISSEAAALQAAVSKSNSWGDLGAFLWRRDFLQHQAQNNTLTTPNQWDPSYLATPEALWQKKSAGVFELGPFQLNFCPPQSENNFGKLTRSLRILSIDRKEADPIFLK